MHSDDIFIQMGDCILATCNLAMAFQADRHVFPQHNNVIVQYVL